jgi:hypothetical protein
VTGPRCFQWRRAQRWLLADLLHFESV